MPSRKPGDSDSSMTTSSSWSTGLNSTAMPSTNSYDEATASDVNNDAEFQVMIHLWQQMSEAFGQDWTKYRGKQPFKSAGGLTQSAEIWAKRLSGYRVPAIMMAIDYFCTSYSGDKPPALNRFLATVKGCQRRLLLEVEANQRKTALAHVKRSNSQTASNWVKEAKTLLAGSQKSESPSTWGSTQASRGSGVAPNHGNNNNTDQPVTRDNTHDSRQRFHTDVRRSDATGKAASPGDAEPSPDISESEPDDGFVRAKLCPDKGMIYLQQSLDSTLLETPAQSPQGPSIRIVHPEL